MLDIVGKTMLERVVRRVQKVRSIDRVVVATTTNAADDVVATAARSCGAEVTRGNEEDVLSRFRQAAEEFDAATCVRICADSPLIDPSVCDLAVEAFRRAEPGVDYASNKLAPSFPLGLDVEVFSRAALERASDEATESFERSHVTVYIRQNPHLFRLLPVVSDRNYHSVRWTVDTLDDLRLVRTIFERLGGGDDFSWMDVVDLIEREPELGQINAHIRARSIIEG